MQKKSKTILAAVVTALFVLSLGYFALLAPTTAWFYQEETAEFSFEIADFNVQETPVGTVDIVDPINLRAATRFADKGEWLFDEVIHVVKVRATNAGDISGEVLVTVNGKTAPTQSETGNPAIPGLRWCVLETPQNTEQNSSNEFAAISALTNKTKGAYKQAIETMLTDTVPTLNATQYPGAASWALLDYTEDTESMTGYAGANYDARYENYNTLAIAALDKHNQAPVFFGVGEAKVIYVVFWAEYDETLSTWTGNKGSKSLTFSNLEIQFTATPATAITQTLELRNTTSSDVAVSVNYNGAAYAGTYKIGNTENTAVNGAITVPANGSVVIAGLGFDKTFSVSTQASGVALKDHYVSETGNETTSFSGYVSSAGAVVDIFEPTPAP